MPYRDEFDDPETLMARLARLPRFVAQHRTLAISGVVFVCVVALSGVIWASYPSDDPIAREGGVPIIRADAEPYKYQPEDRGGMPIRHRDSTIFSALRNDGTDSRIENLLAEDGEQPIDRQELFAGLKTDMEDATSAEADDAVRVAGMGDVVEGLEETGGRPMSEAERRAYQARKNREALKQEADPLPGDGKIEKSLTKGLPSELKMEETKPLASERIPQPEAAMPEPVEEVVTKAAPASAATPQKVEPAPQKTALEEPSPAKMAAQAPAAGTPKAPVKTGSGDSYVQVSSVPEAGRVPGEWKMLVGKLPMLTGLDYRVQKADLGAKGTFHRIQVGPMTKADATDLCNAIKAKKPGGCLIAR